MTREMLETELRTAGVPQYAYNLTGQGRTDERLCLERFGDRWNVFYLERGIKTTDIYFDSEKEACHYLYEKLMEYAVKMR